MMVRHYLLNDDGKTYREVDLFGGLGSDSMEAATAFALQLADDKRRNVGDDTIAGYRISTKFLGIDSTPLFFDAPPRPFECMAFGPDVTEVLGRFETWEQADAHHRSMVKNVRMFDELDARKIDLARRLTRIDLENENGPATPDNV